MQIPGLIDPVPVPRAATPRADGKTAIVGLTRPELIAALVAAGLDATSGEDAREPGVALGLSPRRRRLRPDGEHREATRAASSPRISSSGGPRSRRRRCRADGTRKWLLRFDDGNEAECVFIPDADRGTLCVSAQVGCTLNCRFCFTGTMKLVRNLTPGEIVGQVMLARDALGEWPAVGVKPARAAGGRR